LRFSTNKSLYLANDTHKVGPVQITPVAPKTGGKPNPYFRLTTTADDDAVTWLTNYGTV